MSNYKLTFKLRQHTPIIHFQHDHHGATLRASELKPKLDKFLIENSFGGILNFEAYKKYLLGDTKSIQKGLTDIDNNQEIQDKAKAKTEYLKKQKLAFDYKVRLNGNIINSKLIPEGRQNQYGFFFGTIGDEYKKNPKGLSLTENEIDLTITSFKDGLLEIIEANIATLFEQTNFGTRQSKGFGSFTITKQIKDQKAIDISFSNSGFKTFFTIELNNRDWFTEYKKASETMNLLYKCMRSGLNLKNSDRTTKFYFKSLMFLYAKEKYNSQWEKKTVKENFFPKSKITTKDGKELYFKNRLDEQQEKRPYSDPLHFSAKKEELFKDLLGLSSDESWFSYKCTISKVQAKKVGQKWLEETKENTVFDRYKSPILFKPILINKNKLSVYLYLDQKSLDEAIKTNKDFMIKNDRNKFHLSFPDSFSLDDFFNFMLDNKNFSIQNHVEKKFQNQTEYHVLKNMFNDLRNNKK